MFYRVEEEKSILLRNEDSKGRLENQQLHGRKPLMNSNLQEKISSIIKIITVKLKIKTKKKEEKKMLKNSVEKLIKSKIIPHKMG